MSRYSWTPNPDGTIELFFNYDFYSHRFGPDAMFMLAAIGEQAKRFLADAGQEKSVASLTPWNELPEVSA